ncbi:hypothetical protein [Streptomyces sp. LN785]|uniref:hypothetical protein n=1 Tax=Streptomyces sp. LN785 TaxID=3112983 RepID=UPI003722CA28
MNAEGHVMADEQYAWLDREAAERLFRGEPVEPADGHARTDAERLAAALAAAARDARPADAELPGEAAALAAFRGNPRAARGRAGATAPADARPEGAQPAARDRDTEYGGPGRPAPLGPVRIGRAAAASSGGRPAPRWSRPVRYGLVASLAGCALGGVAVAAGAGILPGPFGGHAGPLPASSVSASAVPEQLGSGGASGEPSAPPSRGSDTAPDTAAPPPRAADGTRRGTGGDGDRNDRSGEGGRNGDGGRDDGSHASVGAGSDSTPGDARAGRSGEWLERTLRACRDYRDGKLDQERRRRLETLAGGGGGLDRFCRRLVDGEQGGNGRDGQGEGGAGRGNSSSDAVRSLWFGPVSAEPSVPVHPGGTAAATTSPAALHTSSPFG